MPDKVRSAGEAMELARAFVGKRYTIATPLRAVREGDNWHVDIRVGALVVRIVKVSVDAKTGAILAF
jgi:hypothetical protein